MMWNGYYGMGYGFGYLGIVFTVFWWILIVVILVSVLRWLRHGRFPNQKTAMDILKERYAKGEIDKREFEEKKKDLIEISH